MKRRLSTLRMLPLACVIIASLLFSVWVFAETKVKVPPPKGTQCVEPTPVMRRQHFEFILHQRDDTVVHGIRTTKHSLKGCIDCHITADENGDYARYASDKHFCANCHQYAAVKIDCFDCHADRPEHVIRQTLNSKHSAHIDYALNSSHIYTFFNHASAP